MTIDTPTMDQIISNVFDEMLGMTTETGQASAGTFEQQRVVASIRISGIVEEVIVVEAPIATANRVGETMFAADPDSLLEDEICDAIGEVVNMIGGNVKGTYDGESSLSLPCVSAESGPASADADLGERTVINVSGHPLLVRWRDVTPSAG